MSYAADHAGALADLTADGTAVTFTVRTPGTHDPATGTFTSPTTATVGGYAIRSRGPSADDMARFRDGGAQLRDALVLLFAPSTYGDSVDVNATCTWAGESYTVREVKPVAPDGTGIVFKVTVTR